MVFDRASEDAELPLDKRRMLSTNDIWDLDEELSALNCAAAVEHAWNDEVTASTTSSEVPSVMRMIVWGLHGQSGGILLLTWYGALVCFVLTIHLVLQSSSSSLSAKPGLVQAVLGKNSRIPGTTNIFLLYPRTLLQ
jgi:hypothetical protein